MTDKAKGMIARLVCFDWQEVRDNQYEILFKKRDWYCLVDCITITVPLWAWFWREE